MTTVAEWLAGSLEGPVPITAAHRSLAIRTVQDLASVVVAGRRTAAARVLDGYLRAAGGAGPAALWGTSSSTDPESAALVNGGVAQSLDFDDIAPANVGHLSSVMVPAIAALSHEMAAGRAVDGLVAGLMVADCLSDSFVHSLFWKGLQPTQLLGTLGAVAGLAHGLRLEREQAQSAFAIAASGVIGLRSHTGTRFKGVQFGVGSAGAVRSVLLARHGMTAGADALDVVMRLFGYTDEKLRELTSRTLTEPTPIAQKAYPACGGSHAGIEGTLELRRAFGTRGGDPAAHLTIATPVSVLSSLPFSSPVNPDQARFSLPYVAALAWLNGVLRPEDFDEPAIDSPAVRAFMRNVTHRGDEGLIRTGTSAANPMVVTAEVGGESRQVRIDIPLGYPERPLSAEQRRQKFVECLAPSWNESDASAIFADSMTGDVFDVLNRRLRRA